MKYVISENKSINLVGNMVEIFYPNFTEEKSMVSTYTNGDDSYLLYYDPETLLPFAKFYIWTGELQLETELFYTLESAFGVDKMTFVIDWFNDEFDSDAEYITF